VSTLETCPACTGTRLTSFLSWESVPVHSCLLVPDEDAAVTFPRGDLDLVFCEDCGLVANRVFDAVHNNYSSAYEETQGYSGRFCDFSRALAKQWVDRYGLAGKRVVEIGCGKGEFLVHMAEAGIGRGVGIDPGVHPERIDTEHAGRLSWVQGFFPDDWPGLDADAVVCRHTLEHIAPVGEFMRTVRRAIGDRTDTVVLFELPDVLRVLQEGAFWDVYYEHCAYFSAGSLARLFRATGFEVLDVTRVYEDQYLLIEARPSTVPAPGNPYSLENDMDLLRDGVRDFAAGYESIRGRWLGELGTVHAGGGRSVIWGSGSKGVAFLAALGARAGAVAAAVDINPHKHGMYMAGSGHRIIRPSDLRELRPDLVIAMNPAYRDEIADELDRLGVATRLEVL
jgi:SAM-dependent methyltransferase